MSYVIDHARLSHALDDLMRTPFPGHPDDERLAEWIVELAELDGHLAGLAHSALSAGPTRPLRSTAARDHAVQLLDVAVADVDEPILRRCHHYIRRLRLIEDILAAETHDAAFYEALRASVRGVLIACEDRLPTNVATSIAEYIDANECPLAVEVLSETLAEAGRPIDSRTVGVIDGLVQTMDLDDSVAARLRPLARCDVDGNARES